MTAPEWAAFALAFAGVVAGLAAVAVEERRWIYKRVCVALLILAFILVTIPNFIADSSESEQSADSSASATSSSQNSASSAAASSSSPSPLETTTAATVSTPEGPPADLRTYLADLDPVVGGWIQETTVVLQTTAFSIDGVGYQKGLWQNDCFGRDGPKTVTYELDGAYAQFETAVEMTDYTDATWQSQIDFVIGNAVVATEVVQRGDAPIQVSFSVEGAFSLSVIITTLGGNAGCGYTVPAGPSLGDPVLIS